MEDLLPPATTAQPEDPITKTGDNISPLAERAQLGVATGITHGTYLSLLCH